MHDSRQQRILRVLRSRLLSLALLLGVVLLAPAVWAAYGKERDAYRNNMAAQAQLSQLQEREVTLSAEVANLKTERGVEGALRHQFDVGEEGEQVIFIIDRQATSGESSESTDKGWFWWWPW